MDFSARDKLTDKLIAKVEKDLRRENSFRNLDEVEQSLKDLSKIIVNEGSGSFLQGPQLKNLISIGAYSLKGSQAEQLVAKSCIDYIIPPRGTKCMDRNYEK